MDFSSLNPQNSQILPNTNCNLRILPGVRENVGRRQTGEKFDLRLKQASSTKSPELIREALHASC